jgi:hypothetical protein
MSDFAKHYFCIAGNARFGLEWINQLANLFVSNCRANFGMLHEICVNGIALKTIFDVLLNYWPADMHFLVVSEANGTILRHDALKAD